MMMKMMRTKLDYPVSPFEGLDGMANKVTVEKFSTIDAWINTLKGLRRVQHVFMLPSWINAWRQTFEPHDELYACVVKVKEKLIGAAPLSINGPTASFTGDPEVFDYMDFAVVPGYENEFYDAVLDDLLERGVTKLDLRCLRPESTVFPYLITAAEARDMNCSVEPDGVSVELDLPKSWEEYLNLLDGKQRHEIRRKFRKLHDEAETRLLVFTDPAEIAEHFDGFLKMFRESRADKALFMNPQMETFFRSMARAMSEEGFLRLFMLMLNGSPAAECLCFDYLDTVYLYNSGYDPRYSTLSVGLLCKILSIKHCIESGRKKYDFLKGAESYKYHLDGKEVQLSRCRIIFK
jgi:CelD/BcsL family acetyltransferase involved in cellulose biosynthesis